MHDSVALHVFHVPTVLQELLALIITVISVYTRKCHCCSIAVKNADHHTQCWVLVDML